MTYTIETMRDGQWTSDGIGDSTGYETRESAERATESLVALGGEWAEHEYRVVESGIEIGRVIEEWTPDEGEADPMQAYVCVAAKIDGQKVKLGVVVGVPDHLRGSAKAAGGDVVGPYLTTWWSDSSDWQDVPADRREQTEEALADAAPRLWREARP